VCSLHALYYQSYSENTPEAIRVELEIHDDEANSRVNKRRLDAEDDEGDVEANTNEVVSNLLPSRVSLAKKRRESILHFVYKNSFLCMSRIGREGYPFRIRCWFQ
jgi:hypothetical protein